MPLNPNLIQQAANFQRRQSVKNSQNLFSEFLADHVRQPQWR